MKTKVLFSALAVASLFAACNNEDLLTNEENKKFENAELLGKGLSLNLSSDAASTKVVDGRWEAGDKAGLAWLVKSGNENSEGSLEGILSTPWANHMYVNQCGDAWTTSSNIYKGWHFAYYPFTYQDGPKDLIFDVNGASMKDGFQNDQYEALHISAADYLDATKIDGNAGRITTAFSLKRVVNILKPILNISEDFTGNELLKNIKITGIQISTPSNTKIFQNTLKVVPSKLPTFVYDKKGQVLKEETNNQFTNELIFGENGALVAEGEPTYLVKTTIDETIADDYKLDGEKVLRVFVAPVSTDAANLKNTQVSIRVNVEGGYFNINVRDKVEDNQKAIKKLYSLLSGVEDKENNPNKRNFQGVFYNAGTEQAKDMQAQIAQRLVLTLNKANFTPDFNNIRDIKTWDAAVNLANALEMDDVTFNLTGAVEFPEGDMNVPNAKTFKVKSTRSNGSMKFTKKTNWNEKINGNMPGIVINVEENAELSVNATLDYVQINNKGVIKAGPKAQLGAKDQEYVHNDNRIIVEYGAFVYTETAKTGIIAYNVTSSSEGEISRINTLMKNAGNTKGHANVNTLIVSTKLDINAPASATGGSEDPYNGAAADLHSLSSLSNINIELAQGSIIYTKGDNTAVKSITAVSGNNTVTDIATTGNMTTNAGAVLTVKSEAKTMVTLNVTEGIRNNGTLNAETSITCKDINNATGTIHVSQNKAIIYTNSYTQGGTVVGTVNKQQ